MRILNTAKTKFLLIFVIILCSYTFYTTAVIREFSHKEEIDFGQVLPRIWDSKAYDDGTMVIRIIRKNATTSINNYLCFYEVLSLRIINLDGTVVEKNLKLNIQSFNYCVFQMVSGGEWGEWMKFLKYFLNKKNQILITYYNATDFKDPSTYVEWGMVMDFDGNISSRSSIGKPFIDNNLQLAIPNYQIVLNINREKGFMRYVRNNKTNHMDWKQFRIEHDGAITELTSGGLVLYGEVGVFVGIHTVNEGYAFIFSNSTLNATNPLSPRGQVSILPIGYNQNPSPSLLIYQTTTPNLNFTFLFCDIAFFEVGHPSESFYIKINFLSSGSVLSFQSQANSLILPNVNPNPNLVWAVNSLTFGGYLLTNIVPTGPDQHIIYGFLIDGYNSVLVPWEFHNPVPLGIKGVYQILRNNTLLVSQLETEYYYWRFQVIDLPKFNGNKDKGYFNFNNFNVESTDPAINSTISPDIQNVKINFYGPVELSDGSFKVTIGVFANSTADTLNATNPLLPKTTAPNLAFVTLFCDIALVEVGHVCILTILQTDPTGTLPLEAFYIKINFLSSGSVLSFQSQIANSLTLPVGNAISQSETDNSWRFQAIDLPKFDGNKDKGYFNVKVESTYPTINSTISPDIQNITINFYDPVELSDGKLTIYQLINNQPYLRQYITESSCTVNNNRKTVNARILDSTFSVSGGIYYIKMDNNFVRHKTYKESLLGIRDNIWSFNVKQKEVPFAFSMNDDLSNAIPVSRSCLTSNEKTQLDPSVNENQYLISIGVEETRVNNNISVETVVNNINTMVKSKDLTLINNGQASKYLDQSYGFIPTLNLWEKYKYNLLGILLIIGLLIVLFFFARRRNSNVNYLKDFDFYNHIKSYKYIDIIFLF
ncbi:hypothetical protein RhiirC2_848078 [Rhizophagus irregularis]|uniref:Uncharacterized protein n=1 Tax=Rhizophagus irregularis TaxID=588596 RepID=A0A2N1NG40_9GLOM|nr:hypothetical protein RhiirC2_848078 [Rhizophagus irregularis]